MPGDAPEPGDKVAWNWGGGAPGGEVVDKKEEGEVAITSKRGNVIKKNAEPDNPAVHVGRSGQDVVKKASELEVTEEGSKSKGKSKSPAPPKKRDHEEAEGKEETKAKKATKAKKDDTPSSAANGEQPKKSRGRPKKGSEGGSGAKPKKDPKPRATEGIGSRTRSRA